MQHDAPPLRDSWCTCLPRCQISVSCRSEAGSLEKVGLVKKKIEHTLHVGGFGSVPVAWTVYAHVLHVIKGRRLLLSSGCTPSPTWKMHVLVRTCAISLVYIKEKALLTENTSFTNFFSILSIVLENFLNRVNFYIY